MGNLQSANDKFEAERIELETALASGEFGRANNLVRMLSFVCEKYFAGKTEEIKEYSIAVEAFGRPRDFDPQADTIVRVTAHALRKRLEDYYRTAGAQHAVHICLPPGHYIPRFIHKNGTESANGHSVINGSKVTHPSDGAREYSSEQPADSPLTNKIVVPETDLPSRPNSTAVRMWIASAIAIVLATALIALNSSRGTNAAKRESRVQAQSGATVADTSGQSLRAQIGSDSAAYVDKAGLTWEADHYCSGGNPFAVSGHAIQGTNDPQLFSAGRTGLFHCDYPVPAGTYEVHLLLAETANLLENSRHVWISVNGTPAISNLDVVDDAGGDDIATTQVLTDVRPQKDGMIHLESTTPDSFVNAIEILPGNPHSGLPVRISTGPSLYRAADGNMWMPDRYFSGGRVSHSTGDLSRVQDGHLYEWHRYGHFHYSVPVATGAKYTLKLYFLEGWFGGQGGAVGGEGSRVFDISCNGNMLQRNFDIFKEAGSGPLVKTFPHIEPTAQGKIEIYFTPGKNYPSVSSIEIIPE